jgi:hypothetical protein
VQRGLAVGNREFQIDAGRAQDMARAAEHSMGPGDNRKALAIRMDGETLDRGMSVVHREEG